MALSAEEQAKFEEMMNRSNRLGTARAELMDSIQNAGDPYKLAEAFKEATEQEKSIGKLMGKLLQARGYAQIESAMNWYEEEYKDLLFKNGAPDGRLSQFAKNMILVTALQTIAGATHEGYTMLVKILVKLNQSGK